MSRILSLLGVTVVAVSVITLVFFGGRPIWGVGEKLLPVKEAVVIKVDKNDPNWLENYCLKEVKNLPEAPFSFTKKDVHARSRTGASDTYLHKNIPDNKWFKAQTCVIWYDFDPKQAYPSLWVEYTLDIKASNTFEENTDVAYTKVIDKDWKKISPLSNQESGNPRYVYGGMPLVFTRENNGLGTVEYATVSFGSKQLYVHFIVYER